MKKYAVIGDPVAHSLSPAIYNPLFEQYGIDAVFEAIRIPAGAVSDVLSLGLSGFACTMPHKQAILPYLDGISPEAARMQSVNIVRAERGIFFGCSTDGPGLAQAISSAGRSISGASVLIYGAGGAARSAAYALQERGALLSVCARNPVALHRFSEALHVSALPAGLDSAEAFDIFINATPLGMEGHVEYESFEFLHRLAPKALVIDMVYQPRETALLCAARSLGLATLEGLDMLLHQAALAFSFWTGILPDVAEIKARLVRSLA